jgi:flagellar biosynthesis protein FlhF
MQVKSFEAITMRDAIKAVKTEFGRDAVILSTKEKKLDERTSVYEVTAAVPEQKKTFGARSLPEISAPILELGELSERLQLLEVKLNSLYENIPRKTHVMGIEAGLEELKTLLLESLRESSGTKYENLPPHLADIQKQLSLMSVNEAQQAKLIKYLQDLPAPENAGKTIPSSSQDYYRSHAIRWMLKRIKIAERWQLDGSGMQLHAFIGPSGSGKSSMVAKLAANFKKQHKAKVLIVSFDNNRLASTEQMRIYSRILDVAFESINAAEELESVLDRNQNVDLVFIDTGGCSPKSSSQIKALTQLSEINFPIDFHLVIPSSDKESQMERCVRSFSPLSLSSVCFTKLDESWSYGEIFNISSKWSIPISYFSTGSRIPEDIERATKERVVERIFGL